MLNSKLNIYFFVKADKIQDLKQINSISLQDDKISLKSQWSRRNIWLKINPFTACEDLCGGKFKF